MKPSLFFAAITISALASAGCSSESQPGTDGGTSDSGSSDSGTKADGSTTDGGAGEGGTVLVNACDTYEDKTASTTVEITWDLAVGAASARCTQIKAGSKIVLKGDFSEHPLAAFNGDTPNPFDGAAGRITGKGTADEATETTFAEKGVFGFHCTVHASMKGAIKVVP